MIEGAELVWEWEMYGAEGHVRVDKVEDDRLIRFILGRLRPVESDHGRVPLQPTRKWHYLPAHHRDRLQWPTPTPRSRGRLDSTAGFTFLLSSLKAALEHDITLRVVLDAHPLLPSNPCHRMR